MAKYQVQQMRSPRLGKPEVISVLNVDGEAQVTEAVAQVRQEIRNGGDEAGSDWVRTVER